MRAIGDTQGPNMLGFQGVYWTYFPPHGLGPLRGSRSIKTLTSPKLKARSWVVVHNSIGHQSSTSPSHPPASLSSYTARTALIPAVKPSPIVTSQQLQPVASSSRRREELSPLLFPAAQVFQQRERWPIGVTREDPNTASEN
ncbi:hypothetical protein O181_047165 [Austropuccinia psidii MF-1]|uniref:Uncharacterized protein n=1 Tax=Austropuccinia psidii MF-1 TaxID=1389203 RepID=A0A9Q3DPQ7_9BASI|nr:hypothetical protein [Austropuccinia psidii MF-1]